MKINPSENIPKASSTSESWVQWHVDLKKMFGKKKANSIWVYAWSKRGGVNSEANTRTLANYMQKQGVDIDRTLFDQTTETIADFTSGVFTIGKVVLIGGLVLGGVVLLTALNSLRKDPSKIAYLTPQGRALKTAQSLK